MDGIVFLVNLQNYMHHPIKASQNKQNQVTFAKLKEHS